MYKEYLIANNLQWLICHETQPNQTKISFFLNLKFSNDIKHLHFLATTMQSCTLKKKKKHWLSILNK